MRALLILLVLTLSVFAATPASAGGFAVTTLDAVPDPTAGQPVDITFTIRQHGRTPVDLGDDVSLVARFAGEELSFPAEMTERTGHYLAEVTFPTEGTWSWSVVQGVFGEQDLGPITVAPTSAAPVATDHRWPAPVRFALPATALVLIAVALADLATGRGRRRPVVA